MIEDTTLLFADPAIIGSEITAPSPEPVHDWITAKVSKLLRESKPADQAIRGVYGCGWCGYNDILNYEGLPTNDSRLLADGTIMYVLARHYAEYHRADVPPSDIHHLVRLMGVKPQPETEPCPAHT